MWSNLPEGVIYINKNGRGEGRTLLMVHGEAVRPMVLKL
jgi:hypothetical protein